jgi:cardiolipin synthase
MHWLAIYYSVGWAIRAAMIPVVLRREFAPGAGVAWLGIVFLHPYIGLTLYLLVGETRLGRARGTRYRALTERYRAQERKADIDASVALAALDPIGESMMCQADKIGGLPVCAGNDVELILDAKPLAERLVAEINAARHRVDLLYYIIVDDATGRPVADALVAAVARGVRCRLLADAVASRCIFRRHGLAHKLRAAGVQVVQALPADPIRRGLPRMDLRNHRKLAIIDGHTAYAGSHNLINPDYGGRHGGPWVDLTGRFIGPVVRQFSDVFAQDWEFETGECLDPPALVDPPQGAATLMQVVPTGPSIPGDTYRRLLLAAIHCARSRLILTTPYFVPDEPSLIALMMAADRGVHVTLILPAAPDHRFTAAAGRAHYSALMASGIEIFLYRPGLIHSKTTTVDDAFALFGSANFDVRSFNLNFELSVLAYGPEKTGQLRKVQQDYLADSDRLDAAQWARRPAYRQYADRAISLLSPLL